MVARPIKLRKLAAGCCLLLSSSALASCTTEAGADAPTVDAGGSGAAVDAWHSVFDDLDSLVLAGWAASDDDAFFVGEDGFVLRYRQSQWYQLEVPTRSTLWWVWGTAPGDVYAGGEQGTLLHFDGQRWRSVELGLDDDQTIWGIWGATADDMWLVGGNARTSGSGFVLRGNGTRFEQQAWGQMLPNLFKVWGRSQDDVHLVGDRGMIIHFHEGQPDIGYVDPNGDAGGRVESLFTVAGNSAGEMVIVGGVSTGMLLEKAPGSAWVSRDPRTLGLNGVAVMESGEAYAVGLEGAILRRAAGQWRKESYATDRHYHSAVSMGDIVFAVGGDLLSPKAERRGLVVARGTVSSGPITWVSGADAGIPSDHSTDASTSVLDAGEPDAGNPTGSGDGGPLLVDSGIDSGRDSGSLPEAGALPGPAELCTAELECAAATECWFIQGENEDRCVTPCETPDQCPADYGPNPQCASPGCQTLYTVCMPADWIGCL